MGLELGLFGWFCGWWFVWGLLVGWSGFDAFTFLIWLLHWLVGCLLACFVCVGLGWVFC